MFEMVGRPVAGRTFRGERRVRLGDCSPGGRLRLDAAARYLQDLSDDDTRDAGLAQMTWVVRRTVIDVARFPTYLEPLDMMTWCSGIGSRWAERRVDIDGAEGGCVRSSTLWVHLDAETLRPMPPPAGFHTTFATAAAGRSVTSRLTLGGPPAGVAMTRLAPPLRRLRCDGSRQQRRRVRPGRGGVGGPQDAARAVASGGRVSIGDRPRSQPASWR